MVILKRNLGKGLAHEPSVRLGCALPTVRQGGAIARRLDPGSERERVGPVKVGVITELDVVFAVDPEGFSELAVDPVAASLDSPFSAGVNRVRDDVALAPVER